jgi:hypothetical protein
MIGFVVAGGTAVLGAGIHTFFGSAKVVQPFLKARDLRPAPKWLMFLCWHAVSVLLVALAVGFGWAAWSGEGRDVGLGLTVLAGLLAALTFYVARRARFNPLKLPPFVLFCLMTVGGAWGLMS